MLFLSSHNESQSESRHVRNQAWYGFTVTRVDLRLCIGTVYMRIMPPHRCKGEYLCSISICLTSMERLSIHVATLQRPLTMSFSCTPGLLPTSPLSSRGWETDWMT